MDPVEREYVARIDQAAGHGDNDRAFELSVGLREYQQMGVSGPHTYDEDRRLAAMDHAHAAADDGDVEEA